MTSIPKTCLLILDGFGYNKEMNGNAILSTSTPNLDYLWNHYPHTLIKAAEEEVGLSFGEMGNSEVGHLSIGTGRVLLQSLPRITESINNGSFFQNQALLKAINQAKVNQSKLHVMGMVSVAGVHAHLDHLLACLKLAKQAKLTNVYLHIILDGRDSGPHDAPLFIEKINQSITKLGIGKIASISGRSYAMDRNRNWDKTLIYLDALLGIKGQLALDPLTIISQYYQQGFDDESIPPTIIIDTNNQNLGSITNNDSIIFTNYREDRARQIAMLLCQDSRAPKVASPSNLVFTGMTEYDSQIPNLNVAFKKDIAKNTLSDHLHNLGIPQIHISETEKYAHVTYFFNGGREAPYPDETYLNIPSLKPEEFINHPEMSALGVYNGIIEAIKNPNLPFIIANFANPDMIGHTGNFEAAKSAINIIDQLVGNIYKEIINLNGSLFITSDHGNSESMIDPKDHTISKDHTSNPVPFIAISQSQLLASPTNDRVTQNSSVTGLLIDVAPSILSLINLPIPTEMEGAPLFLPSTS